MALKSPRHPRARNNRIIGADFMNRTRIFELHFELMLRRDRRKSFFDSIDPSATSAVLNLLPLRHPRVQRSIWGIPVE